MQPNHAKSLRRSFSTTATSLVSIIPDALPVDVNSWSCADVVRFVDHIGFASHSKHFEHHKIDGPALLQLDESDLKQSLQFTILGDAKRFMRFVRRLQRPESSSSPSLPTSPSGVNITTAVVAATALSGRPSTPSVASDGASGSPAESSLVPIEFEEIPFWEEERWFDSFCKFVFSGIYMLFAFVLTVVVMTFVHERVPDSETYPPLPDIFLDNIKIIPGAFELAESIILFLCFCFTIMVLLHQHRWIILRRFNVICATVFLLRCGTMFATSLSVPGPHLQCQARVFTDPAERIKHVWRIMSGFAMAISGVRTCGDYMFSGHTTFMTLFAFFLLEYSPHSFKGFHYLARFLNYFGAFLVLAAHEHYTIDVVIAYLVTSRLFLYYHSLANHTDATRDARIRSFFPFFTYIEEYTVGMLPNHYEWPLHSTIRSIVGGVLYLRDKILMKKKNGTSSRSGSRSNLATAPQK